MGKALLAFATTSPAETVIGLGRLHAMTPKSIVRAERLVDELETIRQRGYSICDEENHLGVRSVAMVVMRGNQPARAAIGVQGPSGRLTDSKVEAFADVLRGAADLIAQLPMLDKLPAA